MNDIEYLIISSTLDFSTDYVCLEMKERNLKYLRLNRDCFRDYSITYDLEKSRMSVYLEGNEYLIEKGKLKSVFFRAPVFIRNNKTYPVADQLYRSQWSSFIRNLIVFSEARWLNHPVATYRSENKLLQLELAKNIGFEVPETIVSNDTSELIDDENYVVKALDTPLFYENGMEMFTYSTIASGREVKKSSLRDAPVIIQKCLCDKIDYRVTVIGNKIYSASITKDGKGIEGDWRKTKKEDLKYTFSEIPFIVKSMIFKLMNELGLSFGGVDLAFCDEKFYFIEINPTGEWGWLVSTIGFDIHKSIVEWMIGEE